MRVLVLVVVGAATGVVVVTAVMATEMVAATAQDAESPFTGGF
jgi:hypothetical protein